MKKFINFCKKPLLIVSSVMFACFMVMLIVLCNVPHGKSYTVNIYEGSSMSYTFNLKKDNVIEFEIYAGGEFYREEGKYKVIDGYLYIDEDGTSYEKYGKINAFEIVLSSSESDSDLEFDFDIKLKCKTNVTFRTLSIVMMSLTFVLAAGSCVIMVLDKKGLLSKAKSTEIAVATETEEKVDGSEITE